MVAANLRNTDEETMVTLNELLQRGRTHEREEGRAQGFWEGFREGELEKRAECVSQLWDEETGQAFEALLSQTDATSWPSLLDLYSAHQRGHNPLQLLDASANPQVREEDLHEGRVETQLAKYAEYVSLCWGKETGRVQGTAVPNRVYVMAFPARSVFRPPHRAEPSAVAGRIRQGARPVRAASLRKPRSP